SVCDGSVVALFIKNYEQGDEQRTLNAIEFPNDSCDRHSLLLEVTKILEQNPAADCRQLGVIGYACTPCEMCRYYAVRLLLDRQAAPEWLCEECRYDSCEECRKLVEKAAGLTEGD